MDGEARSTADPTACSTALGKPRTLEDMGPGDHLCCIYDSEEEHRALLLPFLRLGLQRGEKVIYIVDAHTAREVLGWLEEDGWDTDGLLGRAGSPCSPGTTLMCAAAPSTPPA